MSKESNPTGAVRIGDWVLVAELNLLRCDAREVRLEPRHADLLVFMSAHRGDVVSTDEIIRQVWNGQVVTDHSVYQAIAKLRKAFGDSASQPRYIETVSKRGYRLIADVARVPAEEQRDVSAEPAAADHPARPQPDSPPVSAGLKRQRMSAVLAMVVMLLGALWFFGRQAGWGQREYHTVAVLPFAALSELGTDRFVARGFSIELANALGQSRRVRVIGPISAQLASSLGASPPEIGSHLDADVVVDGSIRRANQNLTVSGVITEVESGHRLWSEVFDRSADDVLAIQREVAEAVTGALRHTVEGGVEPPQPHMQPRDIEVYDNYLLGRYYRSRRTQQDLQRALQHFSRALELDPRYFPASRGMAAAHLLLSFYGNEPLAVALENAEPFLQRTLDVAPDDAELLALIGLSHYLNGSPGLAEEFLARAVSTHPNLAEAWMWLGLARQQQGRLRDALAALESAGELEPLMVTSVVNHANALSWSGEGKQAIELLSDLASTADETFDNRAQLYRVLSSAQRDLGALEEAYAWAARAIEAAPDSALSKANMAVTLGLLGQTEAAGVLARAAYEPAAPGRAVMEYLGRGNVASMGILPENLAESRLDMLRHAQGTPEIDWRMANMDAGMLAYYHGELDRAVTELGKALNGRTYPVTRADDDVFACASLVDAKRRSGRTAEADDLLVRCEEDLKNADEQGWNSLSLAISRVRMAVLRGDPQAGELLTPLFERGFRNPALLSNDPVLKRLEQSTAYRRLFEQTAGAIDAAWKKIAAGSGA